MRPIPLFTKEGSGLRDMIKRKEIT